MAKKRPMYAVRAISPPRSPAISTCAQAAPSGYGRFPCSFTISARRNRRDAFGHVRLRECGRFSTRTCAGGQSALPHRRCGSAPTLQAVQRLLDLLADRDLELRVGVPLDVDVARPGDWPLALLPRRLAAL